MSFAIACASASTRRDKRLVSYWSYLFFVFSTISVACAGEVAKVPLDFAPDTVGELGRREAIVIQGNKTFSKGEILDALDWHIDYHLAAHPRAPVDDYAALLAHKISLGYQHGGFPEAMVTAVADVKAHRIAVQVTEGPRFRCGKILISGAATMTTDVVQGRIRDKLESKSPASQGSTNLNSVLWSPGEPAAFDGPSRENLRLAVVEALEELNYFRPPVNLKLQTDSARGVANLQIDLPDEGAKGAIGQIEVTGIRSNTRQAVLDYLKLQTGMAPNPHLVNTISNELRNSGRFIHQEVLLMPQGQAGQFRLELDLDELPGVAALDQRLSPGQEALTKLCNWLMDWRGHSEDLVWSIASSNSSLQSQIVLSSAGLAFALRDAQSKTQAGLNYAVILSRGDCGFYSFWRHRKFVFAPASGEVVAFFRLEAAPQGHSQSPFNLTMGAGFNSTAKTGEPVRFEVDLLPAAFLYKATQKEFNYSLADGVLTAVATNAADGDQLRFQVATNTGRLVQLEFSMGSNQPVVTVRSQKDVFEGLRREIVAAATAHTNDYRSQHGFSAWLAFVVQDLLETPLTDRFLKAWAEDKSSEPQRKAALGQLQRFTPLLTLVRDLAARQNLSEVFEPLNQLFTAPREGAESGEFFVPLEGISGTLTAQQGVAVIGAWVLSRMDALLPRDSWPWVLAREAVLNLIGQGNYTGVELQALLKSEAVGPAGCVATAYLLGKVDPKHARDFAHAGLERLNPTEFHKDYRVLVGGEAILSQVLANVLGSLGSVSETQMATLAAFFRPEDRALLEQLSERLRGAKTVDERARAAWPAIEKHFTPVVGHYLELGLNRFLPQVQFISEPGALYARGRALMSPDSPLKDFEEAAQCFHKAADLGHGGAQLWLGSLYEQGKGVPRDYAAALSWYRKAFEKHEPHASCRIADLYRDGKGVTLNRDEAAGWYLIEAEKNCAGAQYNLGQIRESQQNLAEALKWYRRASEGGLTAAQVHLADLLTDGFSAPLDYVEACQWLLLATQAENNRITQVQLRRIKSKLTPPQLEEAQGRAEAIGHRLEEQKRASEK